MKHALGSSRFLIIFSVFLFSSFAYAQAVNGNFTVVTGHVQVKSAATGRVMNAKLGERVYPEDTVMTGNKSQAKIVMGDGNIINVMPDSRFEVEVYQYKPQQNKKNVLLRIVYGKIRATVQQKYFGANKFRVYTPSAVVGVRGTDFIVSYNTSTHVSTIITFRGRVEFGHLNSAGHFTHPVFVNAGEMSRILAFRRPMPPARMSKDFIEKMERESNANPIGRQKEILRNPHPHKRLPHLHRHHVALPKSHPKVG